MAKNLVIVESPAKSKTIEKYLGSDYKVLSSNGLGILGHDALSWQVDDVTFIVVLPTPIASI